MLCSKEEDAMGYEYVRFAHLYVHVEGDVLIAAGNIVPVEQFELPQRPSQH